MPAQTDKPNDLYRGYEIKRLATGGFFWTDERGFDHFCENVTKAPYSTTDAAMDGIDAYKRNSRSGAAA